MSARARITALMALGAALVFASPSRAQEVQPARGFGQHPFVLSLEHLGGVVHQRFKSDGADEAETLTMAGIFPGSAGFGGTQARLGLHYFVSRPITLGALLNYSDNDLFGTTMLAGVRIGAGLPLDETTAVWIRGGIAYWRLEDMGFFSNSTASDIRPGAEVLFVLQPIEHFGFLLGGMFEISVAGKIERESKDYSTGKTTTTESDFDYMEFGLTFGVLMDF